MGVSGEGRPRRILIRLPNWIGDAVMAAPAILGLGEALPEAEWHLLGGPRSLSLYAGLEDPYHMQPQLRPDASRPGALLGVARRLRRQRFSAALLLPPSFSSALLAWLSGIPLRLGWPTDGRGALLSERGARPVRTRALADQYRELAERLLDRLASQGTPWHLPDTPRRLPLRADEIVWARSWWRERSWLPLETLVLAPGATFGPTKRWPEDRFRSLGERLLASGWNLLWLGGEEEQDLCERLATLTGRSRGAEGPVPSVSVAGRLSLRQSLALLAQARAAVSNDSGALHLAAAAGCPVLGIYGSTSPVWTGPGAAARAILYDHLPCSPCFSATCPTKIECLTGITTERAHAALEDLLRRTEGPRGRPAVFLDRDGTVLDLVPYLRRVEDVRLAPGAARGMRRLREAGYALVLVSNQSAVARGLLDRATLHAIQLRMTALLAREGVALDGTEICPHHPEFTGPCACRKPEPGLLERAAHRLDLNLKASFAVGDARSDLESGRRAGCRTVLVRTGYGRETEAVLAGDASSPAAPLWDLVADDLDDAALRILSYGLGSSSST